MQRSQKQIESQAALAKLIKDEHRIRLLDLIDAANNTLDEFGAGNYSKFIDNLVAIGDQIIKISRRDFAKKKNEREFDVDALLDAALKGKDILIKSGYAFRAFVEAWEDTYFKRTDAIKRIEAEEIELAGKLADEDDRNKAIDRAKEKAATEIRQRRTLIVKSDMNRLTRRKIHLALRALAKVARIEYHAEYSPTYGDDNESIVSQNSVTSIAKKLQQKQTDEIELQDTGVQLNKDEKRKIKANLTAARNTKAAADAIKAYKSTGQKAIYYISTALAALVAITFGLTTGAAVLTTFPVTLPFVIGAAVVFVAGAAVNWMIFKKPVYTFINELFGKDSIFEGLTHYIDEQGEKRVLSTGKKFALSAALLLAFSVGASAAAMTFTSIVGLTEIAAVAALGIGAFLPPVGIALAAIACVCLTALMFRSFVNLLKKKDLKSSFTAPFQKVNDVFSKQNKHNKGKSDNRLAAEKWITLTILGLLTIIGFAALVMQQIAQTGALSTFLTANVFTSGAYAVTIAMAVSYTVSLGLALIGQIPFVLEAIALSVSNVATSIRNLSIFSTAPDEVVISSVSMKVLDEQRGVFARALDYVDDTLTAVGKFFNAIGNGVLVVPSLSKFLEGIAWLGASFAGWIALGSGLGAGLNSFSAGLSSSSLPNEEDELKDKASDLRMLRLMATEKQAENFAKTKNPIYLASNSDDQRKVLAHHYDPYSLQMWNNQERYIAKQRKRLEQAERVEGIGQDEENQPFEQEGLVLPRQTSAAPFNNDSAAPVPGAQLFQDALGKGGVAMATNSAPLTNATKLVVGDTLTPTGAGNGTNPLDTANNQSLKA